MILFMAAVLAAATPGPAVEDLHWMAGRWESAETAGWTEEYWSTPRGGAMIGYSRLGEGDRMRAYEFLRLAPGDDGVPVYLASPAGRPPVPFRLVEQGEASATFANPSHDFPQRITYRREGDRMLATISAIDGGNAVTWTYHRRD